MSEARVDRGRSTVRRWGSGAAIALVVGNVIGSGIFMLPASIAPFGWNAVLGWGLTLLGAGCIAGVFAALARALPTAGGLHGFVREGLGERCAFLASLGYLASIWAAVAAITVAGVRYVEQLIPALSSSARGSEVLALAVIALLTVTNARAWGRGVQGVTVLVKLLPFVLVITLAIGALLRPSVALVVPVDQPPIGLDGIVAVLAITLFSMLGIESAAIPAETIENPSHTVARATLVGTAIAAGVTAISSCAVVLMLPIDRIAESSAPIATFIEAFMGAEAAIFVTLCAIVSCFGCVNGWLLLAGELPSAMARGGAMPSWFAERNVSGVPVKGLVSGAAVSAAFTLVALSRSGVAAFEIAALVTTVLTLIAYVLATGSAFRLMLAGCIPNTRGLRWAAGGAWAFSAVALYSCGGEAIAWGLVLMLVGLVLRRAVVVRSQ